MYIRPKLLHPWVIILLFISLNTVFAGSKDDLNVLSSMPVSDGKPPPAFFLTDADSSHDFDVLDYYITIWPYVNEDVIGGTCEVTFTPVIPELNSIFLHTDSMTIIHVQNSALQTLDYTIQDDGFTIDLGEMFTPSDTIIVNIYYQANVIYNYTQTGFHRHGDYGYTSAEPYGARRWFPCYDFPFDKATATVDVFVPTGYYVAANGTLSQVYTQGEEDVFVWVEEHPIATYLISIACGPYLHITDTSPGGIPLNYYVYPEDSADAVLDFANTGAMIDFYAEIFGEYPFDHYGMAMAHIFNGWGAMEHQSVTTYGDNLVTGDLQFEYIVAHELAHQYWGDCLSPLTFDDIWLNEGFATYSEALDIEARYDTLDGYMVHLADKYFWEDQNSLRYPIYAPPPEKLFGSAVYNKGAWVLHMLRHVMGDEQFFEGMQNYFEEYKYGNVITAEHQSIMEAAYGGSLDWYYQEWVYDQGYPEYDYEWDIATTDESLISVWITQNQSNAPIFTMPIELFFSDGLTDTTVLVWNDQAYQAFDISLEFSPMTLEFDPGNYILKSVSESGIYDIPVVLTPSFTLNELYPNPFNHNTVVPYIVNSKDIYTLKLFNSAGQTALSFNLGELSPGGYSHILQADGLSSGAYWVELSGRTESRVQSVILLK